MNRLSLLLLLIMAQLTSLSAQAGSAFQPGETLHYELRYLGLHAASARIVVGRELERDGAPVWPLIAEVKTESIFRLYAVDDRFVSWWEPLAGRSQGFDLRSLQNGKRRRQSARIDREATAHVTTQEGVSAERQRTHEVQPNALDVASATFALRNHPLKLGGTYSLPIFTGSRQFDLKLTLESVERIRTGIGEREVFRARAQTQFSGKLAAKRDMWVYITTDPTHLVVRIDAELGFGSVIADLASWTPGHRPAGASTAAAAP